MARNRPSVGKAMKRKLIEEAGKKCANPGCSEGRVHIHHIREWAVYETHDQKHMIALCPTCHDAVHHGKLEITDEDLYAWKRTKRESDEHRAAVYVEPGDDVRLHLGEIAITGQKGAIVFELASGSHLSFSVIDGNIAILDLVVLGVDGREIARVAGNHLKSKRDDSIEYRSRPGHVELSAPAELLLPEWAINCLKTSRHPEVLAVDRFLALSLRVMKPGLVRVQGVWLGAEHAVVVTEQYLMMLYSKWKGACEYGAYGEGEPPLIRNGGPISHALLHPENLGKILK